MSKEDVEKLVKAFSELGQIPKADTPEDLVQWMANFSSTVKAESTSPHSHSSTSHSFSQPLTVINPVKLPVFSGDGKDVEFDLWRYSVSCLQKDGTLTSQALGEIVRRSLRGRAARVARTVGPDGSTSDLLVKLDSIFGIVDTKETVLARFYSAKQDEKEDVATWSCRLEDLLMEAIDAGLVDQAESNSMLRNMLWTGLLPALKDVTGHLFDSILDFDSLRRSLRRVERDHNQRKTSASKKVNPAMVMTDSTETSQYKELKGMVQRLTAEVSRVKETAHITSQFHSRETFAPASWLFLWSITSASWLLLWPIASGAYLLLS